MTNTRTIPERCRHLQELVRHLPTDDEAVELWGGCRWDHVITVEADWVTAWTTYRLVDSDHGNIGGFVTLVADISSSPGEDGVWEQTIQLSLFDGLRDITKEYDLWAEDLRRSLQEWYDLLLVEEREDR